MNRKSLSVIAGISLIFSGVATTTQAASLDEMIEFVRSAPIVDTSASADGTVSGFLTALTKITNKDTPEEPIACIIPADDTTSTDHIRIDKTIKMYAETPAEFKRQL